MATSPERASPSRPCRRDRWQRAANWESTLANGFQAVTQACRKDTLGRQGACPEGAEHASPGQNDTAKPWSVAQGKVLSGTGTGTQQALKGRARQGRVVATETSDYQSPPRRPENHEPPHAPLPPITRQSKSHIPSPQLKPTHFVPNRP